jgi:hypothetical protein
VTLAHSPRGAIAAALDESSRTLWLGALSFEDRAFASLRGILGRGDRRLSDVRYVRYSTRVVPEDRASRMTQSNEAQVENWLATGAITGSMSAIDMSPHAFWDFSHLVGSALDEAEWDVVLLDITCLTKLHAVALAGVLDRVRAQHVFVLYTAPESYGYLHPDADPRTGWSDVLVLPLSRVPHIGDEARSRGIVIPGHEGDRLLVALAEVEPSRGVVIMAHTRDRPDFRVAAQSGNSSMIHDLRAARPGAWNEVTVDVMSPTVVASTVASEIAEASADPERIAPVYLYPFGPKVFSLAAAMALMDAYSQRSWLVYPVPAAYESDYSFGSGATAAYAYKREPRPS